MTDEDYMRLAIEQANLATSKGNWPIGSIIVLDNKVIASAHNLVYSSKNRLAHAELIALEAAQPKLFNRLGEATLYTSYEPCPMCLGACLNGRLKRVVFGVDLNDSGATRILKHLPGLYTQGEYNTEFVGGVLNDECEAAYRKGEVAVLQARKTMAEAPISRQPN
jgi:tRNA(adenine34) deaminase